MITSSQRFTNSIKDILHNMDTEENGNRLSLTCDKTDYYRGLLVATVSLIMATNNVSWEEAVKFIYANSSVTSHSIILKSLPLSWRDYWHELAFE